MGVIFDEVVTTVEAPAMAPEEETQSESEQPIDYEAEHFEQYMAEKQRRAKRLFAE